jgi:hypothetical protein
VGGIGLVVNRSFEPGTMLTIELPNVGQSPFFLQLARVIWTKAEADGDWCVGCEFATPLTEDDLEAWLEGQPVAGRNNWSGS